MDNNDFCGRTKFSIVCDVFEKISNSVRDKKEKIMNNFVTNYRTQSKEYESDTFYPIMRLILPQFDHERGAYGIKENTLANIYVRILCLSKENKDAQKLLNYRTPKVAGDNVGDFAEVAYFILRARCSSGCVMTVGEVNQCLDNISIKHASRDPRGVDAELEFMLMKMSALEQKWLIRIILKDLKFGLSQAKILSLFHQDARDLYDVCYDLKKVCETLKDPTVRLNEIEISLFSSFRPMLSQRCGIQDVGKVLPKSEYYYVETKYDGERFQLHYKDGEFKYFSRNGHDYTDTYGCNSSNGILTPLLIKQLQPGVQNCILDGEMMCWNSKLRLYTTKGMDIDVKSLRVGCIHRPCFCVFDILLFNNAVITNKPLVERLKILNTIFKPLEGVIQYGTRDTVKNESGIVNLLNSAIENFEEGIVVKMPNSVYKPGARNAGWYKIKPEYTPGAMVELDLLIIGGYYGEGRYRGMVSQFLLGVSVLSNENESSGMVFNSFCRVGSGCTKEELFELNQKLKDHWKRLKRSETLTNIVCSKEKPDLWIEPQNSYVLQVKATEVVPCDAFKVGYTLRFPRIEKVRYDKPWNECLTLQEFTTIREGVNGKLYGGLYVEGTKSSPVKKQGKRLKQEVTVSEELKPADVRNVKKIAEFFNGLEMCVVGDHPKMTKAEIEKEIVANGGSVVQNPGGKLFCVLTSDPENIRVRNVMKLNRYDVIKIDWLLECLSHSSFIKPKKTDYISITPATEEALIENDNIEINSQEFSEKYSVGLDDQNETHDIFKEHDSGTSGSDCNQSYDMEPLSESTSTYQTSVTPEKLLKSESTSNEKENTELETNKQQMLDNIFDKSLNTSDDRTDSSACNKLLSNDKNVMSADGSVVSPGSTPENETANFRKCRTESCSLITNPKDNVERTREKCHFSDNFIDSSVWEVNTLVPDEDEEQSGLCENMARGVTSKDTLSAIQHSGGVETEYEIKQPSEQVVETELGPVVSYQKNESSDALLESIFGSLVNRPCVDEESRKRLPLGSLKAPSDLCNKRNCDAQSKAVRSEVANQGNSKVEVSNIEDSVVPSNKLEESRSVLKPSEKLLEETFHWLH